METLLQPFYAVHSLLPSTRFIAIAQSRRSESKSHGQESESKHKRLIIIVTISATETIACHLVQTTVIYTHTAFATVRETKCPCPPWKNPPVGQFSIQMSFFPSSLSEKKAVPLQVLYSSELSALIFQPVVPGPFVNAN